MLNEHDAAIKAVAEVVWSRHGGGLCVNQRFWIEAFTIQKSTEHVAHCRIGGRRCGGSSQHANRVLDAALLLECSCLVQCNGGGLRGRHRGCEQCKHDAGKDTSHGGSMRYRAC